MGPLDMCNLSYGRLILSLPNKSFFDILFDKSRDFDQLYFKDPSMWASPTASFP